MFDARSRTHFQVPNSVLLLALLSLAVVQWIDGQQVLKVVKLVFKRSWVHLDGMENERQDIIPIFSTFVRMCAESMYDIHILLFIMYYVELQTWVIPLYITCTYAHHTTNTHMHTHHKFIISCLFILHLAQRRIV